MKSYIKISFLSLAVLSAALTGCLKDKRFDDGSIQSVRSQGAQKIVEIGITATSNKESMIVSLPNVNRDTTFNLVPVVLADAKPASEDVNVVLILNPALIGALNSSDPDNVQSHEEAPATKYSILNPTAPGGGWVVTILKGTNVGYLRIKVNAANFLGFDYALGFQIGSIQTAGYLASSNLNFGVVVIGIKNEYEGEYTVVGFFQHPSVPRAIDQEEYLKTAGATSLFKTLGDLTGTNVILTINPGNTVTVTPGPGTSGTTASVGNIGGDPVYNNTYNPATHTFWLKYGYPGGSPTRIITEKVTLE